VHVAESMNDFHQNSKIFSCDFFKKQIECALLFQASNNPIAVKDKRAENQDHCCNMPVLEITAYATIYLFPS